MVMGFRQETEQPATRSAILREEIGWSGLPGSPGSYAWGGNYHSTYWVDPVAELMVSYMTQVIHAQGLDDHQRLRALIYQALVD